VDFNNHVNKVIKSFDNDATGLNFSDHVGPVLQVGVAAEAVIAAIGELNDGVKIVRRGSYVRVFVPERCRVTRHAIEAYLGKPFQLPGDLEQIMPSFKGKLAMTAGDASWSLATKVPER